MLSGAARRRSGAPREERGARHQDSGAVAISRCWPLSTPVVAAVANDFRIFIILQIGMVKSVFCRDIFHIFQISTS